MWEELKKEWQDDPDPTWLKILAFFAVVLVFSSMMVML
jgi:hypothetical protein